MIIEIDRYYYDGHGRYRWSPQRRTFAWRRALSAFDRHLRVLAPEWAAITVGVPGSGKSTWARAHNLAGQVIVDGVFADPTLRRRAIEIAQHHGVPLVAVWLDTPRNLCIARNSQRAPDRRVPDRSLHAFADVVAAHPPTVEEGFAAVWRLTVTHPVACERELVRR